MSGGHFQERQRFIGECERQGINGKIPGICLQYAHLEEEGQETSDKEDRGFLSFARRNDDL